MHQNETPPAAAESFRLRALIRGTIAHSKYGVVFLGPDADRDDPGRRSAKRRRRSAPRPVLLPTR